MRKLYAWCFLPTDAQLEAPAIPGVQGSPVSGTVVYRLGGEPAMSDLKIFPPGWVRLPLLDTWGPE